MPQGFRWNLKRRQVFDPIGRRRGADILVKDEGELRRAIGSISELAGASVRITIANDITVGSTIKIPCSVESKRHSFIKPTLVISSAARSNIFLRGGAGYLFELDCSADTTTSTNALVDVVIDSIGLYDESAASAQGDSSVPRADGFVTFTGANRGAAYNECRARLFVTGCAVAAESGFYAGDQLVRVTLDSNEMWIGSDSGSDGFDCALNQSVVSDNRFYAASGAFTLTQTNAKTQWTTITANVFDALDQLEVDGGNTVICCDNIFDSTAVDFQSGTNCNISQNIFGIGTINISNSTSCIADENIRCTVNSTGATNAVVQDNN